jgi:hypothetical protein
MYLGHRKVKVKQQPLTPPIFPVIIHRGFLVGADFINGQHYIGSFKQPLILFYAKIMYVYGPVRSCYLLFDQLDVKEYCYILYGIRR